MILSDLGEIVLTAWNKSFEIRRELFSDSFVIMPNHIHAILRFDKNPVKYKYKNPNVEAHGGASPNDEIINEETILNDGVSDVITETHGGASLQGSAPRHGVAYRPPKSISSFVAGFKSSATIRINEYRKIYVPVWQARFHDHIIRNEKEYNKIKFYIENNVLNWQNDELLME
jgi:putative transposase